MGQQTDDWNPQNSGFSHLQHLRLYYIELYHVLHYTILYSTKHAGREREAVESDAKDGK